MIFFTSDTHFWHKAIIEYTRRPYDSVEEMNEKLIDLWNSVVYPEDSVFHLGDFSFGNATKAQEIFSKLNGTKFLIKGNHDGKGVTQLPWTWVRDYYVIQPKYQYSDMEGNPQQVGRQIVLSHFPIESWENMQHGSWHLHGHCHGTLPDRGDLRLDVGVEVNKGTPFSLDELAEIMGERSFVKVDHHG